MKVTVLLHDYENLFSALSAPSGPPGLPLGPDGLSVEQSEAVTSGVFDNAVVYAGPGSGKTHTLVSRCEFLLKQGVPAANLIAVTFSKKSAEELSARLTPKLKLKKSEKFQSSTVHALGYRHTRKKNLILLEEDEKSSILEGLKMLTGLKVGLRELALELDRRREEPFRTVEHDNPYEEILRLYEEELRERGLADFTTLLQVKPKPTYSHIVVDESQDLTSLQWHFLRQLLLPKGAFWLVGDPDQSIYAFRGAGAGIMEALEGTPGTRRFDLSLNFRSCPQILHSASELIAFNARERKLQTAKEQAQGGVEFLRLTSGEEELKAVRDWAEQKGSGMVLTRTRALAEAFQRQGIDAMTIHESKGLEWDRVWVSGCEAGSLPNAMGSLEEERRLFYVAMTRAKRYLTLAWVAARGATKQSPSNFLAEAGAPLDALKS